MTKQRLIMIAGGAAVVAVAVAAALGWWQIALVVVAATQGVLLAALLDTRRRMARDSSMRTMAQRVKGVNRVAENFGTKILATSESARVETSDRFGELDRVADENRVAVASFEKHLADLTAGLESWRNDLAELRGDLRARHDVVDDLRRSVDASHEQIAGIRDELARYREDLENERAEQPKRDAVTMSRLIGQTEALVQLYGRLTPRNAMPSAGGWGIDPTGMLTLMELVDRRRPATVLELGSGTSTLWLGYALEAAGSGRVISIDHDDTFAARTREDVAHHGLDGLIDVRVAPLVPAEMPDHEARWYDHTVFADVTDVDLLIIDGPPKATGSLARYPAVPMLLDRLAGSAVVVLDDATRPDEREVVHRWRREFPELQIVSVPPADDMKVFERDLSRP